MNLLIYYVNNLTKYSSDIVKNLTRGIVNNLTIS